MPIDMAHDGEITFRISANGWVKILQDSLQDISARPTMPGRGGRDRFQRACGKEVCGSSSRRSGLLGNNPHFVWRTCLGRGREALGKARL